MRLFTLIFAMLLMSSTSYAREQISIAGSSTVYPFSTVVAEFFGQRGFTTPVVESTGTGGGMKLFCKGVGTSTPDITNASRAIKDKEAEMCKKNGVTPIEYMIGYDGIVVANHISGVDVELTKGDIFNAVAEKVFIDGEWVDNPYENWNEINPNLPDQRIQMMLPPPTSGTRDAFVELIMHSYCKKELGLPKKGNDGYKVKCTNIRTHKHIAIMGENDNLIVQKLGNDNKSFGVFGYSFLENNRDSIKAAKVNGVLPTVDTIADGSYKVSRPLFFYVKKEHIGVIPGLQDFIDYWKDEYVLEKMVDLGLITIN
jgi:phosphate transport system substrate-binding protein